MTEPATSSPAWPEELRHSLRFRPRGYRDRMTEFDDARSFDRFYYDLAFILVQAMAFYPMSPDQTMPVEAGIRLKRFCIVYLASTGILSTNISENPQGVSIDFAPHVAEMFRCHSRLSRAIPESVSA